MQPPARVTSFDMLRDFRASLATFREDGMDAITAAALEIQRAFDWLSERRKMWQKAVRDRQDEVVQAKAALTRKELHLPGERPPDTTQERKALRRAQARLEEAEDKVEKTKRWEPVLRRAVEEYEAPARGLGSVLEVDVPKALSLLGRILDALDEYAALPPPPSSASNGASP
ncbi:MAG: hypothetical protein U0746_02095 [Gemmataceae bacterium]